MDFLLDTLDRISELQRNPNAQDRQELVNSLDNMALAYSVRRKQEMKENDTNADPRHYLYFRRGRE